MLEETAKEQRAEFLLASEYVNHSPLGMSEIFDLGELKNLKINLSGIHQTENASLAVKAAQLLEIEEEYIRIGLQEARNIGRFEKLSENPLVIFDGAHNLSGTEALTDAVNRYFATEQISIIYAAMADKDIDASLSHLKENGFCSRAKIFTVPVKDNPRAALPEALAEKFKSYGFDAAPFKTIGDAYEKAVKENPVTLICGSLYLYKDFNEYIKERT